MSPKTSANRAPVLDETFRTHQLGHYLVLRTPAAAFQFNVNHPTLSIGPRKNNEVRASAFSSISPEHRCRRLVRPHGYGLGWHIPYFDGVRRIRSRFLQDQHSLAEVIDPCINN